MPPENIDCSNKAITHRRWHSDLPKVDNWLEIVKKTEERKTTFPLRDGKNGYIICWNEKHGWWLIPLQPHCLKCNLHPSSRNLCWLWKLMKSCIKTPCPQTIIRNVCRLEVVAVTVAGNDVVVVCCFLLFWVFFFVPKGSNKTGV